MGVFGQVEVNESNLRSLDPYFHSVSRDIPHAGIPLLAGRTSPSKPRALIPYTFRFNGTEFPK